MPLSAEEQRVLDEMERMLVDGDPDFAHRISGRRNPRGTLVAAVLGSCCGLALVLIGLLGASGLYIFLAVVGLVMVSASCLATVHIHEPRRLHRRRRAS